MIKSLFPSYYDYEALSTEDSIRLMRILPANNSDHGLHIEIVKASLGESEPYEANSYVLGCNMEWESIICSAAGQRLLVTKNCASILRRLRLPDEPRLVWLDAICIDQSNTTEKNAQVAIMGRIYEEAHRVVIDLGEEPAHLAMDVIMYASEETLYEMMQGFKMRDAVDAFYRRPWFGRVWVLQEAFRAKEALAICGAREVPWAYFRFFRIWVDSRPAWETEPWHVELPAIVPYALVSENHRHRTYFLRNDLLPVLRKSRTCKATYPQDKVFALLPLFEKSHSEDLLKIDYAKSPEQVYIDLATYLLSAFGLSFLPCAKQHFKERSTLQNLPTWVPDWSLPTREPWILAISHDYYPLSVSGNPTPHPHATVFLPSSHAVSKPTIRVRGRLISRIRSTSGDLNIRMAAAYHDPPPARTSFLQDIHTHRTTHPNDPVHLPRPKFWSPRTAEARLHPPDWMAYIYGLPLEDPMLHTDNEMANLVTYFCSGRKLASTERGYVGMVPDEAEIGDLVAVLLGCGVPIVVREVGDGQGGRRRWRLVGEAWVWGLMEGEGFKGVDLEHAYGEVACEGLTDLYIE